MMKNDNIKLKISLDAETKKILNDHAERLTKIKQLLKKSNKKFALAIKENLKIVKGEVKVKADCFTNMPCRVNSMVTAVFSAKAMQQMVDALPGCHICYQFDQREVVGVVTSAIVVGAKVTIEAAIDGSFFNDKYYIVPKFEIKGMSEIEETGIFEMTDVSLECCGLTDTASEEKYINPMKLVGRSDDEK